MLTGRYDAAIFQLRSLKTFKKFFEKRESIVNRLEDILKQKSFRDFLG